MVWLRNKKNNFPVCTVIWKHELTIIAAAETIMSSGSVGRSYVSHDEMVDNGHHRFSTSAKKATSTPPKRKDFMSPSKLCYTDNLPQ